MSFQSDRSIKLELNVNSSHPALLEGLDELLRLELISDAQVRQICRQYLSSALPQPIVTATIPEPPVPIPTRAQRPENELWASETPTKGRPSFLTQSLQSLMAELSVKWLLFLGVFMVVVSSGLLAASQWERFPAFAQYGVLLAYTLVFWGVSQWAARQPNLSLTAQTLQLVALLLVPVNFWAMDGFRLWSNPLEWLTVAIASIALTAITVLLFKTQPQLSRLSLINKLGLSYLHWGWGFPGFPLIAVYIGTVLTAIATFNQFQKNSRVRNPHPTDPGNEKTVHKWALLGTALVGYALAILLFRAIFVAGVAIAQLGLAIGICGWIFLRLSQQEEGRRQEGEFRVWEILGGGLLLLGWLVSVKTEPGGAIAVSGLGLWWFFDRTRRYWQKIDLLAIFAIGLQTVWLTWRMIPPAIKTSAIAFFTNLLDIPEDYTSALLSLALFPYLIFMVWVTDWLHHQQKPALANFAEQLTLGFGSFLTVVSSISFLVRSLNLLASTITLGIFTVRRIPTRILLVYLTHITGLLTLNSVINWIWRDLSMGVWASILLALMVGEWLLVATTKDASGRINLSFASQRTKKPNPPTPFPSREGGVVEISPLPLHPVSVGERGMSGLKLVAQSAWYLGLVLAGLSYGLLLENYNNYTINPEWGIVWLIAPIALSGIALDSEPKLRQQASWLSVAGAIAAQFLILEVPGVRLISLGVATALMFVNTRYLLQVSAAILSVGFSLSFFFLILWEGIPGLPRLSVNGWILTVAGTVAALWLLRNWLVRRTQPMAAIYAPAIDYWAIALCSVELLCLTLHSITVYWEFVNPSIEIIGATAILMGAIAYRGWQQPSNWTIYSIGWCLEILAAEGLGFVGRQVVYLAIANIALGLIAQLVGDWWQRRTNRTNISNSWHVMPLLYGGLSAALRWGTFANWTGLTSLGLALIAIGVGRRREEFKPLVYLALIGISVSAYEILWYQLLQMPKRGAIGDALIVMATLGTSIMYAYRVLTPWLLDYLRLTREEIKIAAHLHWVLSSCLLMATLVTPIASSKLLGLGTGIFLIRYAIFQGRHNPHLRAAETWVYLGLLEAAGLRLYWLSTPIGLVFAGPLAAWKPATASVGAFILYLLPWERWGWSKKPFFVAACIWPLVMAWESKDIVHPIALLIAAGFYILLAKIERQIRLTYLTALLIDWALLRWFVNLNLTATLAYVTPPALSLLYIAQIDPSLKKPEQKQTRHILRLLGTSAICFVAYFTSNWFISGGLSLLAIFAGLTLRVRAFLYIGTAAFLLNAINQLVILSQEYSFVKWVIGLVMGSAFIWIAASFETRREQIVSLVQNWIVEFQEWE